MKVLCNLDLQKNEIQNVVLEGLSVAPANPVEGMIYYDTVAKTVKQYDGTTWKDMGSSYILPIASDTTLGGIKIGDLLSIDQNGVVSVSIAFETAYNATTNKAATMADVVAAIAALGTVFNLKGTKATYAEIEDILNPSNGDVWICTADNAEYVYTGSGWEKLGPTIDLSGYLQIANLASDLTGESTTTAPTQKAVHDALALKADATTALRKATGTIAANASSATISITDATEVAVIRAYYVDSYGHHFEVIVDSEVDLTNEEVTISVGTHTDAITVDVFYR